ncbi:MAG: ABC transporter ATP-binding protein [Aestuariivita sp.]|nr:ABC transporter ATP-binding protein [Aestuariivita sp.]MCY4202025.1 ABC transporter ATP-binding protein [Aestuariivita sp.]
MSDFAISLVDVAKSFNHGLDNEVRVLTAASIDIVRGEIVALVAPSGAGKSTLLQIAGLLDSPDSGDVIISGEPTRQLSDQYRTKMRREKVGFVYQFHHLLPEFSAVENVILPQLALGTSYESAKQRSETLLDRVGLSQRAKHRPAQLSGGEQQRVAFCRAVANQPSILLADEPTGNLDPQTAGQVFDCLLELAETIGLTALIATHNPELTRKMSRTARLQNGTLLVADEPINLAE